MNLPGTDLLDLLRYRLHSVEIGRLALSHTMTWDVAPSMAIFFNGKEVFDGKATGFTNAAIEAAIIHSRALLEFVGLGSSGERKLRELSADRKRDDHGIEQYGGLPRVTVANAIRAYPGPATDAEAALAFVIYLANKGLAHTTTSFTKDDRGAELLDIAFRGVPVIMANAFYLPLGLAPPPVALPRRVRGT